MRYATFNMRHANSICDIQYATCKFNMRHSICDMQYVKCKMQHATRKMQNAKCNINYKKYSDKRIYCLIMTCMSHYHVFCRYHNYHIKINIFIWQLIVCCPKESGWTTTNI